MDREGALLALEGLNTASPVIRSFDRQGALVGSVTLTMPEPNLIGVMSYSRGPDGTIVACGITHGREGKRAGFIASISPFGENVRIVRTAPYMPYRMTLAPDGTIWTAGLELIDGEEPATSREKGVIRHFDKSGKLMGSFVPRSTLASEDIAIYGYLTAGKDRVVWYAGSEFENEHSEYSEILHDGTVRRFPGMRLTGQERVSGIALTEDAGTLISTHDLSTKTWRLLTFDEAHRAWSPVELPARLRSNPWGKLWGGDGNRLVFSMADRNSLSFYTVAR